MKYNGNNFEEVLKAHLEWIQYRVECNANGDLPIKSEDEINELRADFSDAKLSYVDFRRRELDGAIFINADLSNALFDGAKLTNANFEGANLCDASFKNTGLRNVNFTSAILRSTCFNNSYIDECTFNYASLGKAYFANATISYCYFKNAKIYNTYFIDAILWRSYFKDADISDTIFTYSKIFNCSFENCEIGATDFTNTNIISTDLDWDKCKGILNDHIPMACPSHGSFVGWKKVCVKDKISKPPITYIVKLMIPEDAHRLSSTGCKCRTDKAFVEDIQTLDGESVDITARSIFDYSFKYKKGNWIIPNSYDEDRFNECSNGIHFFINRDEAVRY